MKKLKSNYAAIVATLALVVALVGVPGVTAGGILVTSKQIKNGAILTQDIRKGAVKTSDIGTSAVGSADIKTGGVQGADIGTGQVGSSDIGTGQVTPQDVTMPDPQQLQEASTASADVGTEYVKLDDVGTYVKEDGASVLQVDWTGTVGAPSGSGCIFQIRVGGQASADGGGVAFLKSDTGAAASVSATALFEGLSVGPHSIEIWVRETTGPGLSHCIVGPVNAGLPQTFVVSEQVI